MILGVEEVCRDQSVLFHKTCREHSIMTRTPLSLNHDSYKISKAWYLCLKSTNASSLQIEEQQRKIIVIKETENCSSLFGQK